MNVLARRRLAPVLIALLAGALLVQAGPAAQAAPKLSVTPAEVRESMTCVGNLAASRKRPVLFLHGTTSNSEANWSWNWSRALRQRRWAHCMLDLPASGNDDIQVSAEYVVRAIRITSRRAGRPISLVGHSQGGMIGRWALKYWPGLHKKVVDYVGFASSNHGTQAFSSMCSTVGRCTAANWQQMAGSRFLTALNEGPETFAGVHYTQIATRYDEIVVPHTSTFLRGPRRRVTNTTVQDLCPLEAVEHFAMAYSHAAWLIGRDALTHRGPARLGRINRSTCGRSYMPGVDPLTFSTDAAKALKQTGQSSLTATQRTSEPRLKWYAR